MNLLFLERKYHGHFFSNMRFGVVPLRNERYGRRSEKSAGKRLKTILGNLTSSKIKGFLLGLCVTAIIQSSSATSVLVVGFVNSGTMTLSQALSV